MKKLVEWTNKPGIGYRPMVDRNAQLERSSFRASMQFMSVKTREIMREVGDAKSSRLSVDMVIHWSRRKRVILDYDILRQMFAEVDFRCEGSISIDQLHAALTWRYPMWKFTTEWSELADLIISRSSRSLHIDSIIRLGRQASEEYIESRGIEMGSFNSSSCWTAKLEGFLPPQIKRPSKTRSGARRFGYDITNTVQIPGIVSKDNSRNNLMVDTRTTKENNKNRSPLDPFPICYQSGRASALKILRDNVRRSNNQRPRFELRHNPLVPNACTAKIDIDGLHSIQAHVPLNRVEPVRPTTTYFNSDYVKWTDICRRCPTAPAQWNSAHLHSLRFPVSDRVCFNCQE